ncbi:MAG: adenosylmethionine--8-amino-7-oxononanoate transaminase [Acidobacteria bacterium]|nr:adenosylmethionine--8-amino-7-oxononanoate transaminase [Acidobacteriota bacterium]
MNGKTLAHRDAAVLWHPYTQMLTRPAPLPIVRGEGVYLHTEDGRRLLDGTSSWWVNIHGHSHPVLNEALASQARQLEHVIFANCTHEPGVELAEGLVQVLPPGLTRIFYSDNGSTAVEVAMKMASQYWSNQGQSRRTFITLHHAYHGDTVGAMSASEASVFTQPFAPMLFDVVRAHAPYCYRCPMGLNETRCRLDCLGADTCPVALTPEPWAGTLGAQLERHGADVAAVLVEPMLQGAGGMIVWPPEFLAGVRRLCDQYGVLMIADEVLTGFGRTGRLFACEHASVSPDILCMSKAVTGGYMPLGVTAATERIYEAFLSEDRTRTFFHGHSFTGNPLACALGVASLRLIEETNAIAKVRAVEGWLRRGLEPLASHRFVGDVRIIGGVGIVELVSDKATKAAGGYLDDVGPTLTRAFLNRGVLLRPLGNVVYAMPPYVITEAETDWLTQQIREVIDEVIGG